MTRVEERGNRKFDPFENIDDVIYILKEKLNSRKIYIKYDIKKSEVIIEKYNEDKTLVIVTDSLYKTDDTILIYGLSDKYIEVELKVIEELSSGSLKCKILKARRATEGRHDLRFKINQKDAVATNFRVSKHTIELGKYSIPTIIKVVIDQFQSMNSQFCDQFKIDVLSIETKDAVLKNIKNTGKALFIQDVSDPESYNALTDDFIDISKLYGSDLERVIKRNVEKGFKSIIVVPVIYITEDEKPVSFAYIQAISKSDFFGLDKVIEVKEMSFRLVDRIRSANTFLISSHQNILNISKGGARLKITDSDLKKYIHKSKGFVFDIVFRLQAPLTIFGEIKTTFTDDSGNLFIGVSFEGNSSRKDEIKRFHEVLKPMEAEYKAKLLKSIRSKTN